QCDKRYLRATHASPTLNEAGTAPCQTNIDHVGEGRIMFLGIDLTQLLSVYGYWAVLLVVAAESMGLPVPGETPLLSAAVYAGLSGHLSIALVIAAAATGAILGDNAGFFIGRTAGERVLGRLGQPTRRSGRALVVGRYLFGRHGGKAVFLGRF